MDLDSSYIEPLIYDWLEDIQETVKNEERLVMAKNDYYMPFIATPSPIITTIFQLSEYFNLCAEAKYIAIHLYDKYTCNHFWELYKSHMESDRSTKAWQSICKKVSASSKIYLMSCLQLASKMVSSATRLEDMEIIDGLRLIDGMSEYSRYSAFAMEFKVFKTVGFRMPRHTPYHCLEILLAVTGLKENPSMQDVCVSLLDVAYLQREDLYLNLRKLMRDQEPELKFDRRKFLALESNALFLAATVVLCGTFCLCIEDEVARNISLRLMNLIDIKSHNIWDMANILLTLTIQQ